MKIITSKSLASISRAKLATAFQKIYSTPPWNEWKMCANPKCQKHWGLDQKVDLANINNTHCDLPVIDYWPTEGPRGLYGKFERLSNLPRFRAAIALTDNANEIAGFCWGYEIPLPNLNQKFNSLDVTTALEQLVGEVAQAPIYLADIAVDRDYREMGLATQLLKRFIAQVKDCQAIVTVTKGGDTPSVSNAWFERLGIKTKLAYNDERNRVVQMARVQDL